jgi:hypothetical protein
MKIYASLLPARIVVYSLLKQNLLPAILLKKLYEEIFFAVVIVVKFFGKHRFKFRHQIKKTA